MYKINVYEPTISGEEIKKVTAAIDRNEIAIGKDLDFVRTVLTTLTNSSFIIPVNSGTAATHLLAKALQLRMPNKRIRLAVPNNVFVAAWNSFLYEDIFDFFVVDADPFTWNIDVDQLVSNRENYDAVLVVHNLGNIINVPELKRMLPDKLFVEDNCEGFAGMYEGFFTPSASLAGSISFYGNKLITSGEGGAFATNDPELFREIHKIVGQGQSNVKFIHQCLGYNYRMSNLQAAFLSGQLSILPQSLGRKKEIMARYYENLADTFGEQLDYQSHANKTSFSNWMLGFRFPRQSTYSTANAFFDDKGIETRPMFYPIHYHGHLSHFYVKNTVAERLSRECVIFPSHPNMTMKDVDYVSEHIIKYISILNSSKLPMI